MQANKNIFKIGMSGNILKRMSGYPMNSQFFVIMYTDNARHYESCIIRQFRKDFKARKDIGNEFFEGDKNEMIKVIYNIILPVSNILPSAIEKINEHDNTIYLECMSENQKRYNHIDQFVQLIKTGDTFLPNSHVYVIYNDWVLKNKPYYKITSQDELEYEITKRLPNVQVDIIDGVKGWHQLHID